MSLPYLAYYIITQPLCLGYLKDSPYLNDLNDIVRCFDKSTKHRFRNAEQPEYVKFGSTRDNDKICNIRLGQLKLMGWDLSNWLYLNVLNFTDFRTDIAHFFQPSIDCIIKAVLEQRKSAHKTISVSLYSSFFKIGFQSIFCIFSMLCSWAGLPRATGCSPMYVNYLLPLDWMSFVLKTTCEYSPRSKWHYYSRKLVQKQSCFGWRDLILSRPLRENSRF